MKKFILLAMTAIFTFSMSAQCPKKEGCCKKQTTECCQKDSKDKKCKKCKKAKKQKGKCKKCAKATKCDKKVEQKTCCAKAN